MYLYIHTIISTYVYIYLHIYIYNLLKWFKSRIENREKQCRRTKHASLVLNKTVIKGNVLELTALTLLK